MYLKNATTNATHIFCKDSDLLSASPCANDPTGGSGILVMCRDIQTHEVVLNVEEIYDFDFDDSTYGEEKYCGFVGPRPGGQMLAAVLLLAQV